MNFPIENKKPGNETASPRELMERAMASTIMELMQLRRTLWLVVQKTGPITIDETQCHPLWRLNVTRSPENKTSATFEAIQMPDPTPEQLSKIVEILNGSRSELTDAMQQTELKDHPPAYIEMCLQAQIVRRDDGYWVDAALHRIAQERAGENN